jgi:Rrf2 family protein
MATVLRISDAASLALHTMVLLADRSGHGTADGRDGRRRALTTKEIASTFKVSEAHLAKVLQRLAKAGLVLSAPGPHGGFHLRDGAERTTLLQVYEAIEGPLRTSNCLLGVPVCGGKKCVLGRLVCNLNDQVREHFSRTRLSDAKAAFQGLGPG